MVPLPKDDRMELRVEYPKPLDKPQVSEAQDSKGTWEYDAALWFSGWKFTMPKSSNMIASCIGLLIDPEMMRFVGKPRDAWFIRRRDNNMSWSFNTFPL